MESWVSIDRDGNGGSVRKYHRAVAQLATVNAARKVKGQEELDVKGLYELYGGLVIEAPIVDEEVVEDAKTEVAPVRKGGRPAKA